MEELFNWLHNQMNNAYNMSVNAEKAGDDCGDAFYTGKALAFNEVIMKLIMTLEGK